MIVTRIPAIFLAFTLTASAAAKDPLPIAEVQRVEPVDFNRDVLPFLSENCLACHCKTTAKGGLNLETPELMLKGGEGGPAIVPGKAGESLVLQAAAHLDSDLAMPPIDNKAKAKDLTPKQLGLLKLWIDQGAKVLPKVERPIQWQALSESLGSIFAVAVTEDGQFAACTRANRVFVYHLPSGRCVLNEAAHRDQVNALAFSPDGTLMATGGYREVKLWQRARNLQKKNLEAGWTCAVVSPDGKWLATDGSDGVQLRTWPDCQDARTLDVPRGAASVLRFSPDGARLAIAAGKWVAIWAAKDGQQLARLDAPSDVAALAWMADGKQIASGCADGVIRLWSDTLVAVKELKGHTDRVAALEALPTQRLVSGSADGSICVWAIDKEQPIARMVHGTGILAIAVRPDGQRIVSTGGDDAAKLGTKLWAADGKEIAKLFGNRYKKEFAEARDRELQVATGTVAYRKSAIDAAAKLLQAAQDRAKASSEAMTAKQQDLEAKQKALDESRTAKTEAEKVLADATAEAKKATDSLEMAEKIAQQAKADAAALKSNTQPDPAAIEKANADAAARMQEAAKAKAERDQREIQRKQAADKIEPATKKIAEAESAFKKAETARSVAGTEFELAKAGEEKTKLTLAETKSAADAAEEARKKADEVLQAAKKAQIAADSPLPVRAVAFSPDGATIATAGEDQFVHTWSAETGAPFEVFHGHQNEITALAFAPGGELLSIAPSERRAIVWNIEPEWKLVRTIGTGEAQSPFADRVNALAFSHDGKLLATGGGEPSRGGEIELWETSSGQRVRDLPNVHTDTVFGLEFSPDDKFLASGAADKMARVVDLSTGKVARAFEGHGHHVLAVSWSADGRTLATAGADKIVKVWDATNGERKKNIEGYDKEVTAVRFAGVSSNLLTSSGDNKVRLVSLDGKEVRAFPEVADFMQSAAVTADGRIVVAGGQDGVLRAWNAADGAKLGAFEPGKR